MDGIPLREPQRRELKRQLRATQHAKMYGRTWALPQPHRGQSVRRIAKALGVAR